MCFTECKRGMRTHISSYVLTIQMNEEKNGDKIENIQSSFKNQLYMKNCATYALSILVLDICSILLNKTYAIDTNQGTYQTADNNTMQCIYTLLYGDNLRAGILVHSWRNMIKNGTKRNTSSKVRLICINI